MWVEVQGGREGLGLAKFSLTINPSPPKLSVLSRPQYTILANPKPEQPQSQNQMQNVQAWLHSG